MYAHLRLPNGHSGEGGWGILPTNCIFIVSFSLKQRNEGTKVREKVLVDRM